MRMMGKRQIGEMQPSELVITILISEMIAIPMQDMGTPLINGLIPIFLLVAFEIISTFISSKSHRFKGLLSGRPAVLIKNGIVQQKSMESVRCGVSELMEEIRLKGAMSIDEVDTVIMETNGKLSVFLKPEKSPVTKSDMNISTKNQEIPIPIVINGTLLKENMPLIGFNITKLNKLLKKNKLKNIKSVYFLYGFSDGKTFIIRKD